MASKGVKRPDFVDTREVRSCGSESGIFEDLLTFIITQGTRNAPQ